MRLITPVTLVAALLAGGCAGKAHDTMEIVGPCSLTSECSFPAGGCRDFILSRPVIDVALADSLQLYLDVRNQLRENSNPKSGAANTHDAQVQEAEISYEGVALGGASVRTLAEVPAESESVVKVYAMPEEAVVRLRAMGVPAFTPATPNYWDAVAKVSLKGIYQDNSTFTTGDYEVPFRICNGCLTPCPGKVSCPPLAEGQTPAICN